MGDLIKVKFGKEDLKERTLSSTISNSSSDADFYERMQRIKTSLEKINKLLSDLKKGTHNED